MNKAVESSSVESSAATLTQDTSTAVPESTVPSVSGLLPSIIVTDPNVEDQEGNGQGLSFDINTYSLMTSVGVPVVVGRGMEPTARV